MTKWNPDKIHYLTQSELKRLLSAIKSWQPETPMTTAWS